MRIEWVDGFEIRVSIENGEARDETRSIVQT